MKLNAKIYLKTFIILMLFCSAIHHLNAQGCVAVRGGGCASDLHSGNNLSKNEFSIGANYRYFRSFRHFRGDHEETERVENGTEVINYSSFVDVTINYGITNRMNATVTLPFSNIVRSSMYEHGGNPPNGLGFRASTSSNGIGDVRLGVNYWLVNPEEMKSYNTSVGAGIKLPTGDYNYKDTFYNQGPNRDQTIETVVDQSIQPGDGGTGFYLELQSFKTISNHFSITATGYYLFNPRETNGVFTRNSTTTQFSVSDQFFARLGMNYITTNNKLSFYLGGRIEGIPAADAIGGSEGFRRPGHTIAIEPGINYQHNQLNMSLNVPIALYRNRIQSYSDKVRTNETGFFTNGDAAFADYLISFGVTYRFKKKSSDIDFSEVNHQ